MANFDEIKRYYIVDSYSKFKDFMNYAERHLSNCEPITLDGVLLHVEKEFGTRPDWTEDYIIDDMLVLDNSIRCRFIGDYRPLWEITFHHKKAE